MPLTPIACPNCGNILQANSLEKEGVVGTPCRECGETVFIQTDEEGRVEAIFAGADGGAHQAAYVDEDDDHHFGRGRSKRNFIPLITAGLLLLLLLWVANSVFCTRAKVPTAQLEPEEIVIKTSPTPVASPTPFVLNRESGVVFESGKAQLMPESRDRLEELSKRLLGAPRDRVYEIAGYTDDTGDEDANLKLSLARATAVKEFLRKQGVPAAMLTAKGYGSQRPAGDNATAEGREKNRRIEIVPLSRTTRDLAEPE
jgi:outer membrane protein OmpA-like peptidoglycan-associated protein